MQFVRPCREAKAVRDSSTGLWTPSGDGAPPFVGIYRRLVFDCCGSRRHGCDAYEQVGKQGYRCGFENLHFLFLLKRFIFSSGFADMINRARWRRRFPFPAGVLCKFDLSFSFPLPDRRCVPARWCDVRNQAPCAIAFTKQDSVGMPVIPAEWEEWRHATD